MWTAVLILSGCSIVLGIVFPTYSFLQALIIGSIAGMALREIADERHAEKGPRR
jgi:hypothetical protein